MKTTVINKKVKGSEIVKLLEKAKERKLKIHELIEKGVNPSDIPSELKISLPKR